MSKIGKIVVMGGCGRVGLPLALNLSIAGFNAVSVDVSQTAIDKVMSGTFPFEEDRGDQYLRVALRKGYKATSDVAEYKDADIVVLITGMNVDLFGNPELGLLKEHFEFAVQNSNPNTFFIFRSTLSPGTMELLQNHLNVLTGRTDAHLRMAYCPERTAEKVALEEIQVLPQIVSAFSDEAFNKAWSVFSKITGKGIRLTPVEAEVAKLLANSWRYCEFAISNYFYIKLSKLLNGNFHKVLASIKHDYPRATGFRTPGFAAGPCLLKDTMMIESGGTGEDKGICSLSVLTNEGLPAYTVDQLCSLIGNSSPTVPLAGKTVGILGMAFKADVDDIRCSLSYKIRKILLARGATVLCTDPYPLPQTASGVEYSPLEDVIQRADGFILATPHADYKGLVFSNSPRTSPKDTRKIDKVCVDVWGLHAPVPE
eukprot:gene43325-52958_t